MSLPAGLLPGTWGCAHGSGFLGDMIRDVELRTSRSARFPKGDRDAAWAGHVVVYTGGGKIVQAEWPQVVVSPVPQDGIIWATGQPLTPDQREIGVEAVVKLVGAPYDALSYAYFLAKLAEVQVPADLTAVLSAEAKAGPICSGVMVREQEAMGVDLGALEKAATQNPDFIAPADCLRWGLDNGWMSTEVPRLVS